MPETATAAPPAATALPPFQAVVDAHAASVARFLRGMVGPQAAEDTLQETFLAALRAYPSFDGANPRAWLLTIARNKAIDHHRAAGRRPVPKGDDLPDMAAPTRPEPNPGLWQEVAAQVAGVLREDRAHFVDHMRTGAASPITSVDDAVAGLAIAEATVASAETGREIVLAHEE